MRGLPPVWRRAARLEADYRSARAVAPRPAVAADIERVAAEHGLDPAELLAEAEAIAAAVPRRPGETGTQRAARLMADFGFDDGELRALLGEGAGRAR